MVNSLEGLRGDVKEVAGGVQETLDEVRALRAEVALLLSKVTGALEASSSALSSLVSREVASLQLHLSEQVRGEADALRAELRSVLEGQAGAAGGAQPRGPARRRERSPPSALCRLLHRADQCK